MRPAECTQSEWRQKLIAVEHGLQHSGEAELCGAIDRPDVVETEEAASPHDQVLRNHSVGNTSMVAPRSETLRIEARMTMSSAEPSSRYTLGRDLGSE